MAQGTATKIKKRKKSVLKRAAQTIKREAANRANRTRVRSMMKSMRTALGSGDAAAAGHAIATNDFGSRSRRHQGRARKEYRQPLQVSALSLAYNGLRDAKSGTAAKLAGSQLFLLS